MLGALFSVQRLITHAAGLGAFPWRGRALPEGVAAVFYCEDLSIIITLLSLLLSSRPLLWLQVPSTGEVIPGMSSHGPREYEYVYHAPGAPTLRMWVPANGYVQGTILGADRWDTVQESHKNEGGKGSTHGWHHSVVRLNGSVNA